MADKKIDKILENPKVMFDQNSKDHKTEVDDPEI